jgi:hypothetical protein
MKTGEEEDPVHLNDIDLKQKQESHPVFGRKQSPSKRPVDEGLMGLDLDRELLKQITNSEVLSAEEKE